MPMPPWDRLWTGANLATMTDASLGIIENGAIATAKGRIAWVGPEADLPGRHERMAREMIPCDGAWLTPGLIDCHTHIVFGGRPHRRLPPPASRRVLRRHCQGRRRHHVNGARHACRLGRGADRDRRRPGQGAVCVGGHHHRGQIRLWTGPGDRAAHAGGRRRARRPPPGRHFAHAARRARAAPRIRRTPRRLRPSRRGADPARRAGAGPRHGHRRVLRGHRVHPRRVPPHHRGRDPGGAARASPCRPACGRGRRCAGRRAGRPFGGPPRAPFAEGCRRHGRSGRVRGPPSRRGVHPGGGPQAARQRPCGTAA